MRVMSFCRLAVVPVATLLFPTGVMAQVQAAAPQRVIVVSLEDRKLALVEDGLVRKVYTVSVGKPSSPSPEGTFTIQRRVANPVYQHEGQTILPGPSNPVGTRWMGLSKQGYGIHGTNEPRSIGKAASHGCIRMAKDDLEELYALVAVGDTVRLVGRRDAETARLFDTEPPAPSDRGPEQTAKATPSAVLPEPAPAMANVPSLASAAPALGGTR